MDAKRWASGSVALFAAALLLAPAARADMRAAKKEGKIIWYTSLALPVSQKVCNLYNSKNTGITCEVHRTGSGKLYRRYLQEAKGGVYRADVFHSANIGHFFNLQSSKLIKAYRPKGTKKFDEAFQTASGIWTILRSFTVTPAYNTNRVKASELPKSWVDFVNPRWKNRLVHAHPSYSGGLTVGMIPMVQTFGWGYYKKLAKLKPKIIQSLAAVPAIVARGEADLAVGTASYATFGLIQRGEPLQMFIPREGVVFVEGPNSLLSKAPHPNAAKVFIDYLFTLEAQQVLADNGLYVGHPGVKYPKALPALGTFKRILVPPTEVKKKTKEMRKQFRKIFGV